MNAYIDESDSNWSVKDLIFWVMSVVCATTSTLTSWSGFRKLSGIDDGQTMPSSISQLSNTPEFISLMGALFVFTGLLLLVNQIKWEIERGKNIQSLFYYLGIIALLSTLSTATHFYLGSGAEDVAKGRVVTAEKTVNSNFSKLETWLISNNGYKTIVGNRDALADEFRLLEAEATDLTDYPNNCGVKQQSRQIIGRIERTFEVRFSTTEPPACTNRSTDDLRAWIAKEQRDTGRQLENSLRDRYPLVFSLSNELDDIRTNLSIDAARSGDGAIGIDTNPSDVAVTLGTLERYNYLRTANARLINFEDQIRDLSDAAPVDPARAAQKLSRLRELKGPDRLVPNSAPSVLGAVLGGRGIGVFLAGLIFGAILDLMPALFTIRLFKDRRVPPPLDPSFQDGRGDF